MEKDEISREMRKLYDLRSGIVHGGGKRPSFNDVKIIFDYIRRAVDRGLSLRHLPKESLPARLDEA